MRRSLMYVDLGGGAALLATVAVVVLLGVMPVVRLRAEQADRAVQLSNYNEQSKALEAEIGALRARIAHTAELIESRRLTLLPPGQLNTRIAGIIDSAGAMGLEVLSIEPGELQHDEYYNRVPITLSLTGPLPQFVRYLHSMRSESSDLIVREFKIEARAAGGIRADLLTDWLTRAD